MTIAVIGAGASGMMAALTAAEQPENKILLFERQARVGRKLAVTGNGRCDLTNTGAAPENYHGAQPDFAAPALAAFPPEAALRPRPKAPVRAPNPRRPPAERPPLRAMVLRLVRGGETRTAELGEGLRRTEGGRWGSGKLLAALEGWVERLPGRGREKEGRRQKLGRLLLKLFEWIRRELYADHHRN